MSQGPKESYIEEKVCERAKEVGYDVRKVSWIGRRGAPDRFFFHQEIGVSFYIEFKAPGEDLDPLQVREIGRMRKAGLIVHVIDCVEAGYELFPRRTAA